MVVRRYPLAVLLLGLENPGRQLVSMELTGDLPLVPPDGAKYP